MLLGIQLPATSQGTILGDGRELAAVEKKITSMIAAIKGGLYAPEMNQEMQALRARKAELKAAATAPSAIIDFHPQVAELYRQRIGEPQAALKAGEDARQKAIAALRELIDRIVVVFGKSRGEFAVTIEGRLATILALAHGQDPESMVSMVSMVVGVRNRRYQQGLFHAAA